MTMPLAMALRYHVLMDTLRLGPLAAKAKDGIPSEMHALDAIPGHANDRSSVRCQASACIHDLAANSQHTHSL
jgi:hypothetical protein